MRIAIASIMLAALAGCKSGPPQNAEDFTATVKTQVEAARELGVKGTLIAYFAAKEFGLKQTVVGPEVTMIGIFEIDPNEAADGQTVRDTAAKGQIK